MRGPLARRGRVVEQLRDGRDDDDPDGDENGATAACLSTCEPASCGDGFVQAGVALTGPARAV